MVLEPSMDCVKIHPQFKFTEDYQVELLMAYFPIFHEYGKKFFIGELIWNYADFMIQQSPRRFDGNKKGLLTRERQLKAAARIVRQIKVSCSCKGIRLLYISASHKTKNTSCYS